MKLEIMDTTLRDGEQTPGLAFTEKEKFNIARMLLEEVGVDRIEVASARISEGEKKSVTQIASWAAEKDMLDRVEVLGFVDHHKSIDWILDAHARVVNLLCKGSEKHARLQLKKKPEEHLADIIDEIKYARQKGVAVNIYLEDWSSGMEASKDYVYFLIDALKEQDIKRIMLPDTLGIQSPGRVFAVCREMLERYPDVRFDYHAHNDYDFACANSFMAVRAGVHGVHTSVNGLGERTGNAPLSSVVGAVVDHCPERKIQVDERQLSKISKIVEAFSGIRVPANKPIIGEHVFTQTCGVHADGDSKADLYCNRLVPQRFGRSRKYALGKTSGKASIRKNLEELGIKLDDEAIDKVTKRVVELGDKKESVTTQELPYIVSDVLGAEGKISKVCLRNYHLCLAHDLSPVATVAIEIEGKTYESTETGDGQYDAFMKAITKVYQQIGKSMPELIDYQVSIPPGGQTSALVETVITWRADGEFVTRGLDSDQTASAIQATMKMLNQTY